MRLILFLMLLPGALALEWSEVHLNPVGNDNGKEYIELIGTEQLDGCSISDSSSTDQLALHGNGSDVIMIVESDSAWLNTSATTYTVGSAIGNGLGNTAESITISCNGTEMTKTSYNISIIDDFKEGKSIHWKGGWIAGNMTPGEREVVQPAIAPNSENITCDPALAIALNITAGFAGEQLLVEILGAEYASFEITADGLPFASGDTLTTRSHIFILPEAEKLKIAAYANECDGRQRAIRYVQILQQQAQNVTAPVLAPAPEAERPPEPREEQAPVVTGQVIIDQDRSAIPWIAAFGMVTVAASAAVFLQLLRRGEA